MTMYHLNPFTLLPTKTEKKDMTIKVQDNRQTIKANYPKSLVGVEITSKNSVYFQSLGLKGDIINEVYFKEDEVKDFIKAYTGK